jgi:hypothetical protein
MAHLISQALAHTEEGQTADEEVAAAAAEAAGVPNKSCDLLQVLQRSDLFVYISTYLDSKSLRSLCNSSVRLKEEKKLYLYWTCTSSFSNEYVESAVIRNCLLQKVSCPQRQIHINVKRCSSLVDVSNLNNVHSLTIYNCPSVVDVSALGTVHTLTVSRCPSVVDVSALGTVHTLSISHCDSVVDVSALGTVHTLTIYCCRSVVDLSPLGTVHILTINGCPSVVDVSALGTVHTLTIYPTVP